MNDMVERTARGLDIIAKRCERKIQATMDKEGITRAAAITMHGDVTARLIADDVVNGRAQYAPWLNEYIYYSKSAK